MASISSRLLGRAVALGLLLEDLQRVDDVLGLREVHLRLAGDGIGQQAQGDGRLKIERAGQVAQAGRAAAALRPGRGCGRAGSVRAASACRSASTRLFQSSSTMIFFSALRRRRSWYALRGRTSRSRKSAGQPVR